MTRLDKYYQPKEIALALGSKKDLRYHGIDPDQPYVYINGGLGKFDHLADSLRTSFDDFCIEWKVTASSGTLTQYAKLSIDVTKLERNMGNTDRHGEMGQSFWTFEGRFGKEQKIIGFVHANGNSLIELWLQAPDDLDALPRSTDTPYYYDEHED